MLYTPPT